MNLTIQIPMQYCSLQHRTLLLSPMTGCCFCFASVPSFFLELFLRWSPVAYWAPTDLVSSSSVSYHFAFSYSSWGSQGKNTEVVCHSLLWWTTFCLLLLGPYHLCPLLCLILLKLKIQGKAWGKHSEYFNAYISLILHSFISVIHSQWLGIFYCTLAFGSDSS